MDLEAFASYLHRGGRSDSAIKRCLGMVTDFSGWLEREKDHGLPAVEAVELREYIYSLERVGRSAKTVLWALEYYFAHSGLDAAYDPSGLMERGLFLGKMPQC